MGHQVPHAAMVGIFVGVLFFFIIILIFDFLIFDFECSGSRAFFGSRFINSHSAATNHDDFREHVRLESLGAGDDNFLVRENVVGDLKIRFDVIFL